MSKTRNKNKTVERRNKPLDKEQDCRNKEPNGRNKEQNSIDSGGAPFPMYTSGRANKATSGRA